MTKEQRAQIDSIREKHSNKVKEILAQDQRTVSTNELLLCIRFLVEKVEHLENRIIDIKVQNDLYEY